MSRSSLGRALLACMVLAGPAMARGTGPAVGGAGERVVRNFSHPLPDVPGKSLVAVEVYYAPGQRSVPHRHAPSAFVYAYVVSGSIRSQIEGQPVHVYRAGESFFEGPGSHHVVSENASGTEPAKMLAVFVVDSDGGALTIPDK